jgi:hypothetical protein
VDTRDAGTRVKEAGGEDYINATHTAWPGLEKKSGGRTKIKSSIWRLLNRDSNGNGNSEPRAGGAPSHVEWRRRRRRRGGGLKGREIGRFEGGREDGRGIVRDRGG